VNHNNGQDDGKDEGTTKTALRQTKQRWQKPRSAIVWQKTDGNVDNVAFEW